MSVRILIGDCRERLKDLPDGSVDSVVCDPPYHLLSTVKRFGKVPRTESTMPKSGPHARASKGFMGQTWDGGDVAFQPETWAEVLRVLKPGGHLIAFSGTRTYHRMAVAIEDAGFEVRDMIAWHYGSGFPKSHDISKAIDKSQRRNFVLTALEMGVEIPGNSLHDWTKAEHAPGDKWWAEFKAALPTETWAAIERRVIGFNDRKAGWFAPKDGHTITESATDAAREWEGYGTALKPATEPICLARKPLSEKSIAANVLKWGTGALNIDGCRIAHESADDLAASQAKNPGRDDLVSSGVYGAGRPQQSVNAEGRWPANLCHDGSDEVVAGFPDVHGAGAARESIREADPTGMWNLAGDGHRFGDSGSAARFFYCAKATTDERGEGNNHPTVKPVALMCWLVRLVTPKGGTVLDPFMGSGSTAIACDAEQFNFIGCELSAEYAAIAEKRIRDAAGMFADISVEHSGPATRAA